MKAYFAFGSNMSRARLEARVGAVSESMAAIIRDYEHRFNHFGADGSGKGNLIDSPGSIVHGVLYQISNEQFCSLAPYESGYQLRNVVVEVGVGGGRSRLSAVTFISRCIRTPLYPTKKYLMHYRQGMREHGFPADYINAIEEQARP